MQNYVKFEFFAIHKTLHDRQGGTAKGKKAETKTKPQI
jgi:hypothetical protein